MTAAQRNEQGCAVLQPGPAGGEQLLFSAEKIALGIEHFEIIGHALAVPRPGDACDFGLGDARPFERRDLFGEVFPPGQCIGHFAECLLDGAVVIGDLLNFQRLGEIEIGLARAEIEDREIDGPKLQPSPSLSKRLPRLPEVSPVLPVSDIDGKNAARAAPILARAARSCSSAARISGRASSSSDGSPAARRRSSTCAASDRPCGGDPSGVAPPTSTASWLRNCASASRSLAICCSACVSRVSAWR